MKNEIKGFALIELLAVIVVAILIMAYAICVIIDENKKYRKIKYYKKKLLYEIEYDKYFKMVKRMRRVLYKKKLELVYLKILILIKEKFGWKK